MAQTFNGSSNKYAKTIGLDKLIDTFNSIQFRLEAGDGQKALLAAAGELKQGIEDRVPVLTGHLKEQIFIGKGKADGRRKQAKAIIGVKWAEGGALYANKIEYGDEHNEPQPFFRPGIRAARQAYQDALKRNLQNLVSKVYNG